MTLRTNPFSSYKGRLSGKEGIAAEMESALLNDLNSLAAEVRSLREGGSGPQSERTIIVQQVASSSPFLASGTFDITLSISSFLSAGQLVHYYGSTLALADASDNKPANWVVKENNGTSLVLSKLLLDGYVSKSGGASDGDLLYTFTGGGATQRRADLVDTEGNLFAGIDFIQVVGVTNGLTTRIPRAGFVVGSLNFFAEVG